jgi:hypothetical protein
MRKHVAQVACVSLPFATALVANQVTPGYDLVGHTSTMVIALIVGFAALFAITLNMRDDRDADAGWLVAAGWVLSVSLLITIMMETVILKPGGVDNRQWIPCMALGAIALVASCEREGARPTRDLLLRSAAITAMTLGLILGVSLCISAATGRMSGDDVVTLGITLVFSPLVFATLVQTQRAENRGRAWLGAVTLAFVFMIIVTSEGTYQWSPHYSADAAGRQLFQ